MISYTLPIRIKMEEVMTMKKYLIASLIALFPATIAASQMTLAQDVTINTATFGADNEVSQPKNWREWVFVGAPLTPHALNDGKAPFPEYHNVYVEPSAYEHWKKPVNGLKVRS